MKMPIWTLAACLLLLSLSSVVFAITQNQAQVAPVLTALKFERVPSKVIGGPQKYAVTQATLDLLTRLLKEQKPVTLENNGSLTVPE